MSKFISIEDRRGIRTQDGVDAAIVFGVVRHLGVLAEYDFSTCGDHAELADVDFDDGALCHDAELGVHRALRVLLDSENLQLEGCFQVRYNIISVSIE